MTATSLSIRGADLSFTLLEEAAGNHTTDNDVAAPVERIIARHGANHVRLRLWVDPVPGWNDLESTLVLARRAHAAGLELLLDLHCSDSWADVRNQNIPAAWRGQPPARLADTLSNYCRDVVQALAEQGTPASMVQVGNEITDGFLWPLGRVHQADGEHWPRLVELLDAGIAGARSGAPPGHDLKVMVHIDRSCDNVGACRFYDRLVDANLLFDVIGLSYYPFWHGPLAQLHDNLTGLAERYDRDIVVVETAYPWTLDHTDANHFCTSEQQLPDATSFPATPEGQAAYFEALRACLAQVPGGHGLGFFVWEPGWLNGVGWGPGEPNPYSNLTLFDRCGRGLPALRAFRPAP